MKHKPFMVDWAVTTKCNLQCYHCRGLPEEELPTEVAINVAKEIVTLEPNWVIIEGGEPLLRDGLWDILKNLCTNGLDVNLITNGMLLTAEIVEWLKALNIKVMISFDSPEPTLYERIRVGAKFDQVTQNIEKLINKGLLHSLNFTISKMNYKMIPDLFFFCKSTGVDMVNIIGLKPCVKYEEQLLTREEYQMAIFSTVESADKTGVTFFFDEPFFWACVESWKLQVPRPQRDSKILIPNDSRCILGEYIFIEPDGGIKPCTFAPYVVGNARTGISEVWTAMGEDEHLSKLKHPNISTGRCQGCKYLNNCGGCRVRTYTLTGDWFGSDPICPLFESSMQINS